MKEYNFNEMIAKEKVNIIKTLREILQIKSVLDETTSSKEAPFGVGIEEALNYMLNKAKIDGFETLKDGGYGGHIAYGDSKDILGILCHLDVVPEGKNWTYPPYEALIVDNKIYARGSTDDKGPTIASYYALKIIKDLGIKLKKQVRIILGTDEETGWRGIKHYLANYETPQMAFAPDSDFPLIYGEKGRMAYDLSVKDQHCCDIVNDVVVSLKGGERYNVVIDEAVATSHVDLSRAYQAYLTKYNLVGDVTYNNDLYVYTIKGKASHAMEPQKGINAGTHLCNFFKDYSHHPLIKYVARYHHLDYYCEKLGLDYVDKEMGPITCNIGIIDLDKDHSRVTLDLRYPIRYNVEQFKKVIKKLTNEMDVTITKESLKEPHYVDPKDELVSKLYDAYRKNTHDEVNLPYTIGGGTYAGILDNAVAFGMVMPYEADLAHQKDECLDLDTLFMGIKIYIDAIIALGEIDA